MSSGVLLVAFTQHLPDACRVPQACQELGLTASERYEASDALHGEKVSGDVQADMTYGELVVWLRQWKDRW